MKLVDLLKEMNIPYKDLSLYEQAFTHKSFSNEYNMQNNTECLDYDRLEFLGDAIIYSSIARLLYTKFPKYDSGKLSKIRKFLIEGTTLTVIAKNYNFEKYIRYSKGELGNSANHNKVQEDVFEALIGAITIDLGETFAFKFVIDILGDYLTENLETSYKEDAKSELQIVVEKELKIQPIYRVETIELGKNKQIFKASCYIGNILIGSGSGPSKKAAEKEAAKDALTNYVKR